MASLMVGARRTDGACGTDPRRVEGLEEIGGTLRFSLTATTTHSVGRTLAFEPGTFTTAPSENLAWYGDDHSRLVVLASALPVSGGRVSSGAWAEYAWGSQELEPGLPLVGLVVPVLPFPAATIRSVDIGSCSQHQSWTDSAGCGVADQLLRTVERFAITIPAPVPPLLIPGIETCVGVVQVGGRPGGTWAVELGTPTGLPQGTSDRICVELPARASTSLDCAALLGVPVFLGCAYDSASIRACGSFGTRRRADGHLDPTFSLSTFRLETGPGTPNGPRICELPATIDSYRPTIDDQLRRIVPEAVESALSGALIQRETALPSTPPPGSCSGPPTPLLFRSNCANPSPGLTPDEDCALFVTGDPASTALRASCEQRRSGIPCTQQSDCGGSMMATARTCEIDRRCGGSPFESVCQTDADCAQTQLHCLPWRGECVDSEPVCYWNAELDRIETLPSGLEVVLADDPSDETFLAFRTIGVLGALQATGMCRPTSLAAFGGVAAQGVLGPAPGGALP